MVIIIRNKSGRTTSTPRKMTILNNWKPAVLCMWAVGSARTTHAIYREHVKATDAVEGDSHQRWVLVPPIRNAIIMLLAVGVRRGVGGGGGAVRDLSCYLRLMIQMLSISLMRRCRESEQLMLGVGVRCPKRHKGDTLTITSLINAWFWRWLREHETLPLNDEATKNTNSPSYVSTRLKWEKI